MRSLVIGATGLVGSRAVHELSEYGPVICAARRGPVRADLTDRKSIETLVRDALADVIVIAAAFTNVDAAEKDPDLAVRTNVGGIQNVLEAAGNLKVVYISTDYVFDGKNGPYDEKASAFPLNQYGMTKLTAEKLVLGNSNNLVIRTTNVFDLPEEKNFLSRCIKTFSAGQTLRCPNDQYASPTWAHPLGQATALLTHQGATGIYNAVGPDWMNRAEFARSVAEVFGHSTSLVQEVTTAELGQTAPRPLKGGLRTEKLHAAINMYWPSTRESLELLKGAPARE
jgi:dTDP-4-dehydrorhamnose reductase